MVDEESTTAENTVPDFKKSEAAPLKFAFKPMSVVIPQIGSLPTASSDPFKFDFRPPVEAAKEGDPEPAPITF